MVVCVDIGANKPQASCTVYKGNNVNTRFLVVSKDPLDYKRKIILLGPRRAAQRDLYTRGPHVFQISCIHQHLCTICAPKEVIRDTKSYLRVSF